MSPTGREHREQLLTFGPFQLLRTRKLLLRDGRPVRLGSRAIELLVVLAERAGEVVGKNELMAHVWPDTVVEENNLRVHLTALRKCLGEGDPGARYIINVAGRGYSFVAPVTPRDDYPGLIDAEEAPGNLPAAISRPIGRDIEVATVDHLLSCHRLVTVTGPGGIGKSTVAVAAAERINADFPAGTFFIDLTRVEDAQHLETTVAATLGVTLPREESFTRLVAHLQGAALLLLLDNCEHIVDDIAELVVGLLKGAPRLKVLATSREPLRVDGEQLYQVTSLHFPADDTGVDAQSVVTYSAVQLFVERASSGFDSFAVTESSAPQIARICRWLDGNPLAIEIVAARAGLVGLHELDLSGEVAELLTTQGRRTAAARHRSLRATLDWSLRHLTELERATFVALSVFRGWFTAAAAVGVAGDESTGDSVALGAVMSLAGKSLLMTDAGEREFRYRMQHVTRMYASEKLADQGMRPAQRRHALYFARLLEDAVANRVLPGYWRDLQKSAMEDIRAAIEWAVGSDGDATIAARLAATAAAFGFHAALHDEIGQWMDAALDAVRRQPVREPELELRLAVARNVMLNRLAQPEVEVDFNVPLLAGSPGHKEPQKSLIVPLTQRSLMMLDFGDYESAAQSMSELEASVRRDDDAIAALMLDRVGAMIRHWAGDHGRARQLAERVLRHPVISIPASYSPMSVDRRVSMRVVLARVLWLEGLADQAREMAAEALHHARTDSPNAVGDALGHAVCPIAFWRGDRAEALVMTSLLLEHAHRYALTRWHIAARCFQKALEVEGEFDSVTPLPGLQQDLMGTVTNLWFDGTSRTRAERRAAGWCTAELLRRKAEWHLADASSARRELAERDFAQSLEVARAQGALGWELRSATGLATLLDQRGRRTDARQLLDSTFARVTEGQGTADVRAAELALARLQA